MSYSSDRQWSDRFIPAIKRIVGSYLLCEASLEQDQRENTDLIVLTTKNLKIACRIRRAGYWDKYPRQFTIRSSRDNGAKTELAKIREGFGDWMFYGHTDGGFGIPHWALIDLSRFRDAINKKNYLQMLSDGDCTKRMPNGDGSWFIAFRVPNLIRLEPKILIASCPDDMWQIEPQNENF